jgi:DNA-binding beta-propeller fold protein YncE
VGKVKIFKAPGGPGPYGITTTPDGSVYYASLAGNHISQIDLKTHNTTVIQPPTRDRGLGASGLILKVDFGLAGGMQGSWPFIALVVRSGGSRDYLVTIQCHMLCM